ncbi:MAG: FixH family protein [Bacteroidetes bacterium]|nr:FixH family protein [Bacteroidota bacterium]
MKISWGIKIIISFVVFAIGIGTMVGISMTKNIDLVSENYYERELKYQDRIDMINRTNSLTEKIIFDNTSNSIKIKFPGIFSKDNITGKISFYRAMDKKKDFSVDINKDENGLQIIPTDKLDKGNWKVEVLWKVNDKEYFTQSDIFIN